MILTLAAVILAIAYRLIICVIMALFVTGAVLLIISIGWGIYDRIIEREIYVGKTIKKKHPKQNGEYIKECERCGNPNKTRKEIFTCRYCGYINGTDGQVEITRGGLDE